MRTTHTADRAQAEREVAKLEAMNQAHKAGSLTDEFYRALTRKEATSSVTVKAYVEQWLKECRDLRKTTVERYSQAMEEFCDFVNATEVGPALREIQRETVAAFLRKKRSETSVATTKLIRRVLSAFFNYAVDNEALQLSPVPSSKSLKLTVKRNGRNGEAARRAFTLKELETLYDKAPNDFWRYMLLAGFYCGQRMGDLITIVWGAISFEEKLIRLTTRKTGTALQIPLHPRLGTFLAQLHSKAGAVKPSDPIWPEQSKRYFDRGAGQFSNEFYDEVLLPAGLVPPRTHKAKKEQDGNRRQVNAVSFHCLRHTFVSLLKITGGTQSVAKELAGHSSDAVSDLYTHNPPELLAKAIKKLPEVK